MSRPAGDQPPIPHAIYPDTIGLYLDRKRRRNGVYEAQYKMPSGWTGYRVVGRNLQDAMRTSMENCVRMQHGGDVTPSLPAGSPRLTGERKAKPAEKAHDTSEKAAILVIADIRAEMAKQDRLVNRDAKTLRKYAANIGQINQLMPFFAQMRCADIGKAAVRKFQAGYRLRDGTMPTASTIRNLGAMFRRVLDRAGTEGWCSLDDIPSLSKRRLRESVRRPGVQPEDALRLMGYMWDEWCRGAVRQSTRDDRMLFGRSSRWPSSLARVPAPRLLRCAGST